MKTSKTGLIRSIACGFAALFMSTSNALVFAQDTATKPDPKATTEAMPSPQELVDRCITASGGRANWEKVKSMEQKGTFSMPAMGLTGKLDVKMHTPDMALITINLPGIGEIRDGFNGSVGWAINPMTGPTLKEGDELVQARRQASFTAQMDPLASFESSKTVGKSEYAGTECWQVEATGEDGTSNLYFGVASGLLCGMSMIADTPQGKIEIVMQQSEPKKFGDLTLNSKTTISAMGNTQEIVIDSISFEPIDPAAFKLPPAIATMVKAKEAAESTKEADTSATKE
ncbi:MAG: hypothetical protein CBC35_09875 [Planctomycetes bacterium TMED75]|nr:hypothetical protein [Planctomycetaceae bacterium]OUU91268.1 MAG: hypothetical protein CBC35_09875 [Planctomycetes bacterium TMED75]